MENTPTAALKNSLTSTPCVKRKSLFNPPDISPISRGSNRKRNSATNIVSKIPVKLSTRKPLTKIPLLSGQTKTSDPEKPVLRTITDNDQTDKPTKNKVKKGNKNSKPDTPVAAPSKEASTSASTSIKKDGVENASKIELEKMEILSHEVLSPVSKQKSNLDIDLEDDDGDFEYNKKGKKNISKSKKCSSPKKAEEAEVKVPGKKQVKSARGKKKAAEEDAEEVVENIPEETKINEKIQLDVEGTNKAVESRRVLKKAPNKDQKKPNARNKRTTGLEPVSEEPIGVEDQKKPSARNKRKTVDSILEPVAEEAVIDVEYQKKPSARNKRKTEDVVLEAVNEEAVIDVKGQKETSTRHNKKTADLEPIAEEPVVEDQKKPSARNKRKMADNDLEPFAEEPSVEDQKKTSRNKRKIADYDLEPAPEEPNHIKDQTRQCARVKRVRGRQPQVEDERENANLKESCVDAVEDCEIKTTPKGKKKKIVEENIKEVSMAFSEMGEKHNIPEPKTEAEMGNLEVKISSVSDVTNSEKTGSKTADKNNVSGPSVAKRSRRNVPLVEQKSTPAITISKPDTTSREIATAENTSRHENSAVVKKKKKTATSTSIGVHNAQPSTSGIPAVRKMDVKFESFNVTGGLKEIPLYRIFGGTAPSDIVETTVTPVKIFKSIRPTERVMGGFVYISPSSSHRGYTSNFNMYSLVSDTSLKVNIVGSERVVEKHTSFLVPKDCSFDIENLGSETAILTFTKLRSI